MVFLTGYWYLMKCKCIIHNNLKYLSCIIKIRNKERTFPLFGNTDTGIVSPLYYITLWVWVEYRHLRSGSIQIIESLILTSISIEIYKFKLYEIIKPWTIFWSLDMKEDEMTVAAIFFSIKQSSYFEEITKDIFCQTNIDLFDIIEN